MGKTKQDMAPKRAKHEHNHEVEEHIELEDEQTLQRLSGLEHNHLRILAEQLQIRVGARGQTIHLKGPSKKVKIATKLIRQLSKLAANGRELGAEDFTQALLLTKSEPKADLEGLLSDTILQTKTGKHITPKGPGQKEYVEAIRSYDIVFGVGPAGTGKTYLAMTLAVRELLGEQVSRIILTRPAVEAGEKLGFLPGSLEEKVNPYLRPLYDALFDLLGVDRAEELVAHGVIEVAPLAFMRGRTLNDAFIILDEAQNTTREQMKMFLTRLGFGSKMVITGDITQTDLKAEIRSGLVDTMQVLEGVPGISICRLTEKDVVRHPLVQAVVRAYETSES